MLAFWEDETGQGSIFQTQVQKFRNLALGWGKLTGESHQACISYTMNR